MATTPRGAALSCSAREGNKIEADGLPRGLVKGGLHPRLMSDGRTPNLRRNAVLKCDELLNPSR